MITNAGRFGFAGMNRCSWPAENDHFPGAHGGQAVSAASGPTASQQRTVPRRLLVWSLRPTARRRVASLPWKPAAHALASPCDASAPHARRRAGAHARNNEIVLEQTRKLRQRRCGLGRRYFCCFCAAAVFWARSNASPDRRTAPVSSTEKACDESA